MDHNPFADKVNPYEAPIRAELAERPYQPPRPAKPRNWPPIFAFLWLVTGPFICLWVFRFCRWELELFTFEDDAVYVFFYVITALLWLIAIARVGIWLLRSFFV